MTMSGNRFVVVLAPIVTALLLAASGSLLPGILRQSDDHVLRYTNTSVEGAPPIVVIGTTIGALRGLVVDYLWIKANAMKEKGLFYEAMSAVWSFHGHNMAYNISVATNTREERWEWVNAGIRLVRDQGLRYNPNDMALHRELAFWLSHKIEGVADDAHLYYKLEFSREWHLLLGPPPEGYEERKAWIKQIADAPETLTAAEQRTPGVEALVERLRAAFPKDQLKTRFKLDGQFLREYWLWQAVKEQSMAAKILGIEQNLRENSRYFATFDDIASDPAMQPAWTTLIAHVRKRVLKDDYNMDPELMSRYTAELGPIDWRHGQAHALYWARKGSEAGRGRLSDDDIYISLNNDSQQMTAMQDLARSGRISYDPLSREEMPGRFPDPRWIDVIDKQFDYFYAKHINVRGAGGERFINFLQNFLGSAICEWFREGETDKAQKLMDRLKFLFGGTSGSMFRNPKWELPLDVFVHNETIGEYERQPHLAPRDVSASLRYGYKVGILNGRPEVLRGAFIFAGQVTHWFKTNSWNDYKTKFGEGRIADIVADLDESADLAYLQMIVDPGIRLIDRISIWNATDRVEAEVLRQLPPEVLKRQTPLFRALTYDRAKPILERQFMANELSRQMTFDQAFPAPPGLDAARKFLLDRQQNREREREEIKKRDPFTRMSRAAGCTWAAS